MSGTAASNPAGSIRSGRKEYHPEARVMRFCRRIQVLIAGNENDIRLTDAQKHAAVHAVLKCDPIILAAKIVELCVNQRSKWEVPPNVLHRMTLDLHDRLYPQPDRNTRRRGEDENQFELNFEWQNGVATMSEAAE